MGHPYRRWSSFNGVRQALDELLRTKARLFVAQGTADQNVGPSQRFDVLYATLLEHGRGVEARRIAGADHGFRIQGAARPRRMDGNLRGCSELVP